MGLRSASAPGQSRGLHRGVAERSATEPAQTARGLLPCAFRRAPSEPPSLPRRTTNHDHHACSAVQALLAAFLASFLSTSQASAQGVVELGVQAIATAADPAVGAGGVYAAVRTSPRARVSAALAAGVSDGKAAWRGELLAHFLLNPTRTRGTGVYGAGGIAVAGGPVDEGYIVLTLGIEGRPGGPSGWFAEAGIGGGARVALGYRWRRPPPVFVAE